MALPTWHRETIALDDPGIPAIFSEAPGVAAALLGGGSILLLPATELLDAVEAAAWLEIYAETVREYAVPAARGAGVSWDEIAAAMGVTRASAIRKYDEKAAAWLRDERGVDELEWQALEPMAAPEGFTPTDHDLLRAELPAWTYTGPLEPGIQSVLATHDRVRIATKGTVWHLSRTD
ncbi:hypothetical protein IC607_00865 [Cellulomonas sp. JH27-2]|uniref:hypothetical protein n=1 Tax=Cellulomonas sp. JH27-2 TaxID=2774139 RepID=UPI0017805148|nr:hypothetical protein [Cellulomonas sp. JH27-2]MBD8057520.1 hypothetical protein [Cellulomonas sp. JH27-2]